MVRKQFSTLSAEMKPNAVQLVTLPQSAQQSASEAAVAPSGYSGTRMPPF
jgi:hypothetical protein